MSARPKISASDVANMHSSIDSAASSNGAVVLATMATVRGGVNLHLTVHGFEAREVVLLAHQLLAASAGDDKALHAVALLVGDVAKSMGVGEFMRAQ